MNTSGSDVINLFETQINSAKSGWKVTITKEKKEEDSDKTSKENNDG